MNGSEMNDSGGKVFLKWLQNGLKNWIQKWTVSPKLDRKWTPDCAQNIKRHTKTSCRASLNCSKVLEKIYHRSSLFFAVKSLETLRSQTCLKCLWDPDRE